MPLREDQELRRDLALRVLKMCAEPRQTLEIAARLERYVIQGRRTPEQSPGPVENHAFSKNSWNWGQFGRRCSGFWNMICNCLSAAMVPVVGRRNGNYRAITSFIASSPILFMPGPIPMGRLVPGSISKTVRRANGEVVNLKLNGWH